MFPEQQIEELLSLAYVRAVASRAGVDLFLPERDYGIDGSFRPLKLRKSRRFPIGYALDFQLKASKRCQIKPEHIVYDLEVRTYNDLIYHRLEKHPIPCVLLLKVVPSDSNQWLDVSEEGLFMGGGCY